MSEKIKKFRNGDCVEVSCWEHGIDNFFTSTKAIGLVLESELIEMGDNEEMNMHDEKEWMYRVALGDGKIVEVWDYEIKSVNSTVKNYNTNTSSQKEKKYGSEYN